MPAPEHDALRAERSALAQRLAQGLAAQTPLAELQALQSRLQFIDGVLAAPAPRGRALRRHVIALTVVAALVSLAALLPMPRVAFTLELVAGAAQLQMNGKGSLAAQTLDGELRAEGFARLESADATLVRRAADSGADQLALRAERLALRRISFPAGAGLEFESGATSVRLALTGAAHSAEFELGGQVSSSFAGSPRETNRYPVAEWIKLVATDAPTELWLAHQADRNYLWRGLQPESLRFVERQSDADGQVRLVSALRQATLRLPATERELQLPSGSGLELDGLRLDQAEMQLGDALTLKVSGSARRLVHTSGGFDRSLKPSLLDYAAHNHSLALLWSAAAALWGIGTWLHKTLGDGS